MTGEFALPPADEMRAWLDDQDVLYMVLNTAGDSLVPIPGEGEDGYTHATVVRFLKAAFNDGLVITPERPGSDGEPYPVWATASLHMDEDSGDQDGYIVVAEAPGAEFFLASAVIRPGNANGVAAADFLPALTNAVARVNAMLRAWDERGQT